MVSMDSPEKNRELAESLGADMVLLSDPDGSVADAYGVRGLGGMFPKRWTFYIDQEGVVRYVDMSVDVATAGQDIAARLGKLGFPKR